MKLIIFSIYDIKAKAYQRPFFLPTQGMATRVFTDLANDKQHPIGQHPEDYTLFQLGEFDENTAFISTKTKEPIATALELKVLSHQEELDTLSSATPDTINQLRKQFKTEEE